MGLPAQKNMFINVCLEESGRVISFLFAHVYDSFSSARLWIPTWIAPFFLGQLQSWAGRRPSPPQTPSASGWENRLSSLEKERWWRKSSRWLQNQMHNAEYRFEEIPGLFQNSDHLPQSNYINPWKPPDCFWVCRWLLYRLFLTMIVGL